jgi:hypothetical protein
MQTSSSNQISVKVLNDKNTQQSIKCTLAVGQGLDSKAFHKVVIPSIEFKSFQMFQLANDENFQVDTSSQATVNVGSAIKPNDVVSWVSQTFSVPPQSKASQLLKYDKNKNVLEVQALSLRDG